MKRIIVLAAGAALAVPGLLGAQGQEKTITGEIVAIGCYMNSSQPDANCTQAALSAGLPAGIVEKGTNQLYVAVSPDNSTNVAKQLLSEASKQVEVRGEINRREGVQTITVRQVKELSGQTAGQAQANSSTQTGS